jgi:hypothetical protein
MYQKFALKIGDEIRNLFISCRRNPKVAFKGTKKSKSCSSINEETQSVACPAAKKVKSSSSGGEKYKSGCSAS